ncbi:hypothetical protein [Magnetovibrio blakemorei]|uniref:Uncharacterized protein n=1 Tax=Magnetovibrio blakemorei TaxID=28181 RepID=A0A1E5Q463_9PROT|nr:hypothetical protein [Magnetovibrio blakemorei]OEJ64737.1 hypothetical protein BEN30_16085 [Magnetovibrio blakemorei]OEJ64807.1 hypothetical protein BEN30_15970 [Magnetovibrio blakemorei]
MKKGKDFAISIGVILALYLGAGLLGSIFSGGFDRYCMKNLIKVGENRAYCTCATGYVEEFLSEDEIDYFIGKNSNYKPTGDYYTRVSMVNVGLNVVCVPEKRPR